MEKYGGIDRPLHWQLGRSPHCLNCLPIHERLAMVSVAPAGTNVIYSTGELLIGRRILRGNHSVTEVAYRQLVQMNVDGKYNVDRLLIHRFSLKQINEAFKTLIGEVHSPVDCF